MTGTQTTTRTTTWTIDPAHSVIEFAVKHMMFTTAKGRFQDFDGTITLDEQTMENSRVDVTITTASIDTQTEDRDNHLRSADFFDVETYPEATFRSTRIEPQRGNEFVLYGDLTIKGQTSEVRLDASFLGTGTNPWGQEVAGFEAKGTFKRKDFGLTWNQALEGGGVLVSDEVKLSLDIQAVKANAEG
ncbi:MAG TPA: YceI family protein [Chloroflexota bacterium]|nr:YceI family protein [Chloroflexota bacterium]